MGPNQFDLDVERKACRMILVCVAYRLGCGNRYYWFCFSGELFLNTPVHAGAHCPCCFSSLSFCSSSFPILTGRLLGPHLDPCL